MPGPSASRPPKVNKAKRKKADQKAKKVWAETEAADRTISVGDVSDALITDRFKEKPRRIPRPGGSLVSRIKPPAPPPMSRKRALKLIEAGVPLRDSALAGALTPSAAELRHTAALRAPVSPAARKLLRQTRDPSLPPKLTLPPGRVAKPKDRRSRWDRFMNYGIDGALMDAIGGVTWTGNQIQAGEAWVGDQILDQEQKDAIVQELVLPALEDSMQLPVSAASGIGKGFGVARSAIGDLVPEADVQAGAWAGKGEAQKELAGVAAVPAEVVSHTAKIIRNSIIGGSQIALGVGPGIVYTLMDPEAMGKATVEQYKLYYGPLAEGDFKKFLKNVEDFPLQLPLDLLAALQVVAGALARGGLIAQNMRYVGNTLVVKNPITGVESPVTRRQAVLHGIFSRRTPLSLTNEAPVPGDAVWRQPRHIRYIEREQQVPVATENSRLQLMSAEEPFRRIGGGALPRLSAKKAGQVGLRNVTEDGNMPIIEWQGKKWFVEGIYEKVPVAQRFAPRSDIGRMVTDLYWKMRPEGWGFRQAKRNEIEMNRAIGMGKVQSARAASRWLNQGVLRRVPPKERRARQHAFTQLLIYGDDQAVARTTQEIAKIESDPKLHQTAAQRGRLEDLKRALPMIENQPDELARSLAAVRPLAEKTEALLVRMKMLNPETARQMIRSNFAWLADETPLDNPIRSHVEESLMQVMDDEAEVALAMEGFDAAARAWAADTGKPPVQWYSENLGGARVVEEAELRLLSPQLAREGMIMLHAEDEAARIAAAEAAGVDYPHTAQVSGQGGVAAWDSARSGALASGRGGFLDTTPVGELVAAGRRLYLSADGNVGFSLSQSGDLGHLFSRSSARGAGRSAVLHAIAEGATSLDAFDGFLPPFYSEFGFREVARTKFVDEYAPDNWNFAEYGRPDVVHMAFAPWLDDISRARYVDYETGKHLAASAANGSEGRALFRTFYTKTVRAIEQFPERVAIKDVIPLLKKYGVKNEEIELLRVDDFVAQFKGKSIGREELADHFTEKEYFPVAVFDEGEYEYYTQPGGREEYATIAIYWPRRFTEDEMLNWSRTPEGSLQVAAAERERLTRQNWEDDYPRDEDGNIIFDQEEFDQEFQNEDWTWERYEPEYEDLDQPPPEIYVFQDPHYQDFRGANMLAHVRMTIRTIDAKKTLLIEELQSELFNRLRSGAKGPSDAPLANAWKERMLREVLAYAVDNGIDRIGWVKGEQQAALYNKTLRKNVNKIEVRHYHDPLPNAPNRWSWDLTITFKGGRVEKLDGLNMDEVRSTIGGKMTRKAEEAFEGTEKYEPGMTHTFEGDNITIGFGAASIYEREIPGYFAKYLKQHGVKLNQGIIDKVPQSLRYHDGRWYGYLGGEVQHGYLGPTGSQGIISRSSAPQVEISSSSREALRFGLRIQEPPPDVVHTAKGWQVRYHQGFLDDEVFTSEREAVRRLDETYAVLNNSDDVLMYHRSPLDEFEDIRDLPEQEVPYIDLTPEAIKMIQEGQPHFKFKRGVPVAALHKPTQGAPVMLFTDQTDFSVAMHELAHASLPQVGKSLQSMGDPRYTAFSDHFGITDWDNIPVEAHEAVAAAVELMLYRGESPYPHLRDFMGRASRQMRQTVRNGALQLIPDAKIREIAEAALKDRDIASVLHDIFDFGRGEIPSLDAQFITRHRRYGLAALGQRVRDFPKAGLAQPKSQVKGKATLAAVKEALYEPGADPALRYAAEAVRNEMALDANRWVTEQAVPIPIENGVPQLAPDYAFYRPGETHTTIEQFNSLTRRAEDQGLNILNLEPQELGEFITSITDLAARQQTGGRSIGHFLPDWDTFRATTGLSDEAALAEIREGKILMAPKESINAYLDAVSGAWSLERLDGLLAALRTALSIPNTLAKWRMITKPAYTILNAANAEVLGILHQGVWHPFNLRVTSDIVSSFPVEVLHYLDSVVGGGTAELGRLSDIRPRGRVDAILKGEQALFHKALNLVSTPERRLRRSAALHEFRRYGLTSADDIAEFARRAETDPKLKAIEADIARAAEESMIRFRGMRPTEQALVRNFLFVYGWIRAATRFTLRYPLEHPLLARLFTWMGDYGWDLVREEFFTVPWRYAGGIPTEITEEDYRAYVEMFDLNPVLPQATAFEFMRAIWNSGTDWDVAKDTLADLLAPGAEIGLSAIFGEDNWDRSFMEQIRENFLDWRYFPGVMWINRFMDPSAIETNLRAPGDRMDVAAMFLVGGSAPTTYKAEEMYQRWLDDLPLPIKRIIQHQQNAANLRLVADKAFEDMGGLPNSMAMAIEANEAYEVGEGYMLSWLKAEQKKDDPHVPDDEKITSLPPEWKSGVRLRIMRKIFPDTAAEIEQAIKDFGYDPSNKIDYAGISSIIDGRWDSLVSGLMKSVRAQLKSKGIPEPGAEGFLWGADPMGELQGAYDQEWEK